MPGTRYVPGSAFFFGRHPVRPFWCTVSQIFVASSRGLVLRDWGRPPEQHCIGLVPGRPTLLAAGHRLRNIDECPTVVTGPNIKYMFYADLPVAQEIQCATTAINPLVWQSKARGLWWHQGRSFVTWRYVWWKIYGCCSSLGTSTQCKCLKYER